MTTDSAVAPSRRATFRDVLAVREFRALYVAQTLSIAGDQLARIAIAVIVYRRTGSTTLTGLSYALSYLPWLIGGPLLSGYADRLRRRQVMILCDVVRAALMIVMAIPGTPTFILICLIALVGFAEPPFDSARSSLIPDVVGEGDVYNAAATLGNTTNQLAIVVGFAAGGALVALVGTHLALLFDAGTFVLSAAIALLAIQDRPVANPAAGSVMADLRVGGRAVFGNPQLRWLVVATWLVSGAIITTQSAAVPYAHVHGGGSTTAGLLIASLPLGMVTGSLILGRVVGLTTSERLMMPLALCAPLVLTITAVDPSPFWAGLVWFVAGSCAAMTVTANRVFVVSIPRELRGQAFGIAVTGIAAGQGIFSLAVGFIASYVGPARAIADLSLPIFALLVAFSIVTANFSAESVRPIGDGTPVESKDHRMPESARRLTLRAWALSGGLAAATAALVPSVSGLHVYSDIQLPVWWLFIVLAIGVSYPLSFQVRNQSFQVVLETVPLVLGIVFLPPIELVLVRIAAALVADLAIDRLPAVKACFNAVSVGLATFAAVGMFRWLSSPGDGLHPAMWPATFAAIVTGEVVCGLLVIAVLSLTGARSEFRPTVRVVTFGAGVSVVMTFLALFTAAALEYDLATMWAISVFVFLVLAAAQMYHRIVERAAALDRLYVVARELGPVASDPTDLAPALKQLRQVIRANSLELTVAKSGSRDFVTVVTVSADVDQADRFAAEEVPLEGDFEALLADGRQDSRWREILRPSSAVRRQPNRVSALVRTDERDIGVLSALNAAGQKSTFDRSDVRLLQAAADQLAAALEKGRLVESLRRAATLDTLTGLANLDSLRSFLDTSLEGATGGVVILLNLDRFRDVNEMLGHKAGDDVLAEVARRLESSPAQGALVARVGGDQFAIAIPGAAGSEVARLAAMAVKSRVDGSIRFADVSADVRVTIGIARAPDHGNDAATLIRRAEMAMASAKGGTSGIGEWEPEFERDGSRRLQLLTGLRAALSDNSLQVEYQPKLRLGAGDVVGFEALVRWKHPELGPISPAEFVPIAEATGLISALTSTVLRQALTTCRTWHDAGKPVGVAVNVSPRSLDDNVLVGQVAAMLTASGLEPRWLTLEITESSVMEDHVRSLEVLRELRMLGVRLSIDDFGTGYSSLHQLRGLPVHEVKIDRSFVETVDTDEADRAVVRAVVELCETLSLTTVAEGVEKATQAYALETLGVEEVQGYFHGRPMPADSATEWLQSRRVATYSTI